LVLRDVVAALSLIDALPRMTQVCFDCPIVLLVAEQLLVCDAAVLQDDVSGAGV